MSEQSPPENPALEALRERERELVRKKFALLDESLETPDPRDRNEILREMDDLEARIGVLGAQIKELESKEQPRWQH